MTHGLLTDIFTKICEQSVGCQCVISVLSVKFDKKNFFRYIIVIQGADFLSKNTRPGSANKDARGPLAHSLSKIGSPPTRKSAPHFAPYKIYYKKPQINIGGL